MQDIEFRNEPVLMEQVAQGSDYNDEVTEEDIEALRKHVEKEFGQFEDFVLVSGPAW
jgi:hypothetical protein